MQRVLLLSLIGVFCLSAAASARQAGQAPAAHDQALVRFEQDLKSTDLKLALDAGLFELGEAVYPRLNLWTVRFVDGLPLQQALDLLETTAGVVYAQADHFVNDRETTPDDPEYGSQWDWPIIDAPLAWDLGTGGTDALGNSIVAAICDGGMDLAHNDLVGNLWTNPGEIAGNGLDDDNNGYTDDVNGWDAYSNDGSIPGNSHGTHVAGTVGATGNNGLNVSGCNWNVQLMPVACSSSQTSIISIGYGYVAAQKAAWLNSGGSEGANIVVTNSSFGVDQGDCTSGSFPIWNDLYNDMGALGILSAAATINSNFNVDTGGDVPTGCSSDFLITVTNTTSSDVKYSGAGYGATTIDLGAPGTSVLSTIPGNLTGTNTGTSMSTPHVAGAVAFIHSVASLSFANYYLNNPGDAALQIKTWILDGTDPLPSLDGITVSGGRLNLFAPAQSAAAFSNGPLANLDLDDSNIDYTLASGAMSTVVRTIGNTGEAESTLDWSAEIRPPASISRDMSGSILSVTPGSYTPGSTMVLDFVAANNSPDSEWISSIVVELPAGVTVVSADPMVEAGDPANQLDWDGLTGAVDLSWIDADGNWGNIHQDDSASAAATLDFSGATGTVQLNWTITGDEWGADPHMVSGSIDLEANGPGVALVSPSAGAQWLIGETNTINWTSNEATGLAMVELSRDGGSSWEILGSDLPAAGSLNWTVSGPPAAAAIMRVQIPDDGMSDTGDAFGIAQALNWLSLDPLSGSLADAHFEDLSIQADATGLYPGTYFAVVHLASNVGSRDISVSLTVSGGTLIAPVLQIFTAANTVYLTWAEVPGSLSYRVERAESSEGPWQLLSIETGTSTTDSLSLGLRQYRVIALD